MTRMQPGGPNRRRISVAAAMSLSSLTVVGCQTGITDADIDNMSLTDVRLLWLDQQAEPDRPLLLLVDPRRRDAFENARLPGAVHITLPDVALQSGVDPAVDSYANIVVYAEGPGALSGRAMTKRLLVLGYGQTKLFGGGLVEWSDAGFPIESGEPEFEPAAPPTRDARRPVP